MRFLILRKADAATEAGAPPTEQLIADITRYNEELVNAGVLLAGEGLRPSADGVRMKFFRGNARVIDGPFVETKELIAGFSLFEAESKQAAIDWVMRWPIADCGGNVEIEIREVGCDGLTGVCPAAAPTASSKRFMILLKSDATAEAGILPDEERLVAMSRRNIESIQSRIMLAGEGLQPSAKGARVKFADGKPSVIDGPFAEAKELVAGFWLIQAGSIDEAIEWARSYPYPRDGDVEFEVEVRPLYEAVNFCEAFTPELQRQEESLRAQAAQWNQAIQRVIPCSSLRLCANDSNFLLL